MPKQVVVIGAGIGGLSAAIHARLRGFDVLLLEQRQEVGGKAAALQVDGYRLDPGPSIVILKRLYDDLFSRAGRPIEDYLQFERLDPITRVHTPWHGPIDLPADLDACLQTLADVAPQDSESLRRLMDKLQSATPHIDKSIFARPFDRAWQLANVHLIAAAKGFDVRKSYKQLVDGMFESPMLRAFMYGFPSYGGQTYHAKSFGGLMIPYLMLTEGVWWPRGGIGAIPSSLYKLATDLGVEARNGVRVTGLETQRNRVAQVVSSEAAFGCDAVISNVDRSTAAQWLGSESTCKRPSLSYFTVHWGIRKRFESTRHHTLVIPENFEQGFEALYDRDEFPDPPIVYLNDTTATDPSTAPDGCTNLFAVVTSPAAIDSIDWTDHRSKLEAVRRTIAQAGVDFGPEDVAFERVQTPATFEERDGSYMGSLYGCHESERLFGLFPASNRDACVKNMFYCGGSVQPGAGLPMTLLSGMFAANLV